ncbi:MAG: glycosyltransferase family 39 protein [Nitrospinae bacterium]|nr:glycosyltransferase family 39 protein [Nitrospinota bacterium]
MELLLIPILFIGFLMRIPYVNFPIDADFGILTYPAYFRKRGIRLIKDFWGFYTPAIIYLYIFVARLFGEDVKYVRYFSCFYNIFTILLTFMVTDYLFGTTPALVAALIYAIFSASPYIGGYSCHTEEIYVIPVTLGVFTIAHGLLDGNPTYLLYAGGFIAVAFMIKIVNVIYFAAFIFFLLLLHGQQDALYFFSSFTVIVIICTLLLTWFYRGQNRQLWRQHNTRLKTCFDYIDNSLSALWDRFKLDFIPIWKDTWSVFLLSSIVLLYIPFELSAVSYQLLAVWLLSTTFVFISQRVFRMYQYIPLIQIASILSAVAIYKIFEFGMMPLISGVIFILAVNIYRKLHFLYLYKKDKRLLHLQKADQLFYIPEIARYIKERTLPDDYIYEWGPYVHLYRLADRPSCEGFLFHFVKPYSQWHTYLFDEILKGIILKKPVYIVLVRTDFNIDILRQITGLDYDMERLFFNRYRVYRLKGKVSEPLNIDDMQSEEKIRWLELLTDGSQDYEKVDDFYIKRGMYEEAMNEYREAFKLNPTDLLMKHGMEVLKIITQYNLYSASAENGGREYAKEGFHNILKNEDAPVDLKAGCCFHLGKIYMDNNRLNDATDYFKRCLMFIPQHKKAAEYLSQLRVIN